MPATFSLSDVFISYSRRDKAFVQRLHKKLRESGQEVWVDWEDIPPTADWWNEIQAGIDGASTFIFVISPDSVTSEVCYREVDHAIRSGKRFVPLLYREVTEPEQQKRMHPSIGSHNWVMFHDEAAFEASCQSLIDVLQTDLDYVRTHTRLLVRAREWDNRGRDASFLLSGTAVREAETWLAGAADLNPPPTRLHTEYILASRQGQAARQRRILMGVSVALAVSVALGILSFVLFQQAESNRVLADANAASAATNEAIAVTNAEEAQRQAATSEANANLAATNAAIASTNEAEAFLRGTAVANQAATSDVNATLANINAAIASTNEARAEANAAIASTNEAEAFRRGTAVAHQAATSEANADLAATNAANAEAQARRAEIARQQSQAVALAADAEVALNDEDYEFAILVGIAALADFPYTWQAERVLAMAIDHEIYEIEPDDLPDMPDDPLLSPDGTLRLIVPPDKPQQAAIVRAVEGSVLWTLIGHIDDVTGAAWSPDGTQVATISADMTVRVWHAGSGQLARALFGHADEVTAVAWSPDGSRLVTVERDGVLHIWNPAESVLPISIELDADIITRVAYTDSYIYMVSDEGTAYQFELWAGPDDLLAVAQGQAGRQLTDEEAAFVGLPPAASAPAPSVIAGCADALESHLYPGVFGRVSSQNNLLPLNLRESPGLSARIIGRIAPDQTFQVLDGPECVDGYAWFEVVYGLDARRGWAAEGEMTANGPDYFAEPIPGR
ncbi:MAG TPA: TIR domain-containing protein [Spirillospora sp.]|nr:TIR domain-containing protein [Spirillospora sp.]